jgi:hypothetical protein
MQRALAYLRSVADAQHPEGRRLHRRLSGPSPESSPRVKVIGRGASPQQAAQGQIREGAPHLLRGPHRVARGGSRTSISQAGQAPRARTGHCPSCSRAGRPPRGFKRCSRRRSARAASRQCPASAWRRILTRHRAWGAHRRSLREVAP